MNRCPAPTSVWHVTLGKPLLLPVPFCPFALTVKCLTIYIFCFSYNEILISPEFVIHIMTLLKGLF